MFLMYAPITISSFDVRLVAFTVAIFPFGKIVRVSSSIVVASSCPLT